MSGEIPTLARGKLYPSQRAAAKALGIAQPAISKYLDRNGHLARVGMRDRKGGGDLRDHTDMDVILNEAFKAVFGRRKSK